MDDFVVALQGLAVFAAGLVAGGQILVLAVISRAARTVDPRESLRLHQTMLSTDYPDVYIQPAGIVAFVTGVILLATEDHTAANVVLTVIAMVSLAGIVVLTRTVNRPINRALGAQSADDLGGYGAVRRRWDRSHAARTALGTMAFVSYIILANH